MTTLYDENGNPVEVADEAIGEKDDTKAELERVKAELARTQQTVTRLASKPGMEDAPELTPGEQGAAAYQAAREKGRPQDLAEAEWVRAATEAKRS